MKRGASKAAPERSDEQRPENHGTGRRMFLQRVRRLIEDLGGLAAGAIALAEGVRQLVDWLF